MGLKIKRLTGEFTRQTDVTPYAAQDVVGSVSSGTTILTLTASSASGLAEEDLIPGASYQIKNVKVSKSTNTTTNATFDLYLFSSGVTSSQHDNQPYVLDYNNKHNRIGKTSLTMTTSGSSSTCAEAINSDVNLMFKANTAGISARLVATAAYTPGASEKFYFEIEVIEM